MITPSRIILVVGALLGAAAVVTTVLLFRSTSRSHGDRVEAQIGDVQLSYAPAYARFGPGRSGGKLDRIEMAFTFPDLRPAGRSAAALPGDEDASASARQLVFLTVRPEDAAADPGGRMSLLYARFLQSDVWQEDNGLLMRRFEAGSPYDREELHFVPPEGQAFAARCLRPSQPPSDVPSTCLAAFRSEGLDLDIRFSPTLLPAWSSLIDGVRKLVVSFVSK